MGITQNPSLILKQASDQLKSRSPGMSMRAVAGKLGISPSYWSKILRGEKPLTKNLLTRVVKVLKMDAHDTAHLQKAILSAIEHERLTPATGLRIQKKKSSSPLADYKKLGSEHFWILEQWFAIPLLNMFTLELSPRNLEDAARRLGISSELVAQTVNRFIDEGFLKFGEDGALIRTDLRLRFPTERSHRSIRNYHQEMLKRAKDELNDERDQSFETRLISSVCFAGSSEKLKEAKLILEEALYRAANLMAGEPTSDEIYQLNVQIFPLTR